jgi:polysaccharide deacetylase family protein (PEP-CTERM system associated)
MHALSVDVEDWNNAAVLFRCGRVVPPTEDIVRNTERVLELFDEHDVKATWFVLGEVAEHFPELAQRLGSNGHRVGVHGYHHHRLHELTPSELRESLGRAKKVVEDATGQEAMGFRAPAMSLTKATDWAYEIIAETGFRYSSSIYPTWISRHGVPKATVGAHHVALANGGNILEIPLTVIKLGVLRLPVCGGGYLRHFPLWWTQAAMRLLNREGRSAVVYFHPHELVGEPCFDPFPIPVSEEERREIHRFVWSQFRNSQFTEGKLTSLFSKWRFAPIEVVFQNEIPKAVDADSKRPASPSQLGGTLPQLRSKQM